MKAKIKILIIFITAIIVSSCEDFLEEKNYTGKTEDIVYSTEDALDNLVAVCYSYNRLWYGREGGTALSEAGSDLWYTAFDCKMEALNDYSDLTPAVSADQNNNNPCLDEYWEELFAAVNLCNTAEKWVREAGIDVLSETKKSRMLAEVVYLRAFYYWHIVETWGDVPYNTTPVESANTAPTREPAVNIYVKMFTDIDTAINRFKIAADGGNYDVPNSRVTYWAAQAFKARLALYYASEYNKSDYYAVALAAAQEVITNSGKVLNNDFENIWEITKSSTETNEEFIWAIDYYEEFGAATSYNAVPLRMTLAANGQPLNWSPQLVRQLPSQNRGSGNSMHVYFTPIWNRLSDATGGPSIQPVLGRIAGERPFCTAANDTSGSYDVGQWYVKYGMGYCRYAPTPYALYLFDESVDERYNATWRTAWYKHPDVVMPYYYSDPARCDYPDMSTGTQTDTVVYISKNPLTAEQIAWASTRYKIIDLSYIFNSDPDAPYGYGMPGAPVGGGTTVHGEYFYPAIRKFESTDSDIASTANFQDYWTYRDFPVFRISEMYLIAAEAALHTPENSYNYLLDLANARSINNDGAAMLTKYGINSAMDVDIDFILEERARELIGENQRWFDLKRTGKLEQQIVYNTKASGNFDPLKHYLRPIPETQMNAISNKTNSPQEGGFWQNPNY